MPRTQHMSVQWFHLRTSSWHRNPHRISSGAAGRSLLRHSFLDWKMNCSNLVTIFSPTYSCGVGMSMTFSAFGLGLSIHQRIFRIHEHLPLFYWFHCRNWRTETQLSGSHPNLLTPNKFDFPIHRKTTTTNQTHLEYRRGASDHQQNPYFLPLH